MPKIVPPEVADSCALHSRSRSRDSASDNVRDLYRRPTPISLLLIEFTPPRIAPWEMRLSLRKQNRRTLMSSIMLVAFALRVFIPPGFMPASGRPFSLEICWEGLPADMLAHVEASHADSMEMDHGGDHHHGTSSHSEHCVFGTACSAGPIFHLTLPSYLSSAQQLPASAFSSIAVAVRVVHLPQPRAPPSQLS